MNQLRIKAFCPCRRRDDEFPRAVAPLFDLLDSLHPHLWRKGQQFPQSQAQLKQMLADGELLMALTFNPNEPANLVASGELPQSTVAWQHRAGTIGNTHFVAIPINSKATAGAQVVANFLLSPEAQGRKADLKIWGDPTVLATAKLSADEAKFFGNQRGSRKCRRNRPPPFPNRTAVGCLSLKPHGLNPTAHEKISEQLCRFPAAWRLVAGPAFGGPACRVVRGA